MSCCACCLKDVAMWRHPLARRKTFRQSWNIPEDIRIDNYKDLQPFTEKKRDEAANAIVKGLRLTLSTSKSSNDNFENVLKNLIEYKYVGTTCCCFTNESTPFALILRG